MFNVSWKLLWWSGKRMNTETEAIWLEFLFSLSLEVCVALSKPAVPQFLCHSWLLCTQRAWLTAGLWKPLLWAWRVSFSLRKVFCFPGHRTNAGVGIFLLWRIQVTLSSFQWFPFPSTPQFGCVRVGSFKLYSFHIFIWTVGCKKGCWEKTL